MWDRRRAIKNYVHTKKTEKKEGREGEILLGTWRVAVSLGS